MDSLKRVECKINGTFDPLIESTNPSVIEDSIISALDERGYYVLGSNVTSGEQLCYCVSMSHCVECVSSLLQFLYIHPYRNWIL